MSGRHTFAELTEGFPPERRARVDDRKAELRTAMPFNELRQARGMTPKAAVEEGLRQPAHTRKHRRVRRLRGKLRRKGSPPDGMSRDR